jgi:hypothetical protein
MSRIIVVGSVGIMGFMLRGVGSRGRDMVSSSLVGDDV